MLGPHTITRLRAGVITDAYRNKLPGGPDAELQINGCSVQPGTGGKFNDSREAVTTAYTVWVPGLPDIEATDRIRFNGVTYPLDASPERWEFTPSHTVLRLRRVDG